MLLFLAFVKAAKASSLIRGADLKSCGCEDEWKKGRKEAGKRNRREKRLPGVLWICFMPHWLDCFLFLHTAATKQHMPIGRHGNARQQHEKVHFLTGPHGKTQKHLDALRYGRQLWQPGSAVEPSWWLRWPNNLEFCLQFWERHWLSRRISPQQVLWLSLVFFFVIRTYSECHLTRLITGMPMKKKKKSFVHVSLFWLLSKIKLQLK